MTTIVKLEANIASIMSRVGDLSQQAHQAWAQAQAAANGFTSLLSDYASAIAEVEAVDGINAYEVALKAKLERVLSEAAALQIKAAAMAAVDLNA